MKTISKNLLVGCLFFLLFLSSSLKVTLAAPTTLPPPITVDLILNPYRTAPLTAEALISIENDQTYDLKVTVHGRNRFRKKGINLSHTFLNRKRNFKVPVLGLYQAHTNQIEFNFIQKQEKQLTLIKKLVTKKIPADLIVPLEIYRNRLPNTDQSVYLIHDLPFAFDQTGAVRWVYTGDSFLNYGKLFNGNLKIMSKKDLRFLYHYKQFYEVSMLGEIVRTYDLSKYYGHHEVEEMPGEDGEGDLLVAANEAAPSQKSNAGRDGVGEEDIIFLIDRHSGEVLKQWDLKRLFDQKNPSQHRLPRRPKIHLDDWIHFNSIDYDSKDDAIIFSSRHQSAVVKYDFQSGKLIWIIADNSGKQWKREKNFYGQVISDYVLTPIDRKNNPIKDPGRNNFWPYGQHDAKKIGLSQDGQEKIMIFDNGNYRNYFQYGRKKKPPLFSRAVEYWIDPVRKKIKKVWEFDHGKQYYTLATGSVDFLENQNRLIGFMWTSPEKKTPRIIEINPKDKIVFEARINQGKSYYYQVEKFDLYQGLP